MERGCKKFGMGLGVGLAGGLANYFIEDYSNDKEHDIETKTGDISGAFNTHDELADSSCVIGIISNS